MGRGVRDPCRFFSGAGRVRRRKKGVCSILACWTYCLRWEVNRRLELRTEVEPAEVTQMVQMKGQDGKGRQDRGGVCKEDVNNDVRLSERFDWQLTGFHLEALSWDHSGGIVWTTMTQGLAGNTDMETLEQTALQGLWMVNRRQRRNHGSEEGLFSFPSQGFSM